MKRSQLFTLILLMLAFASLASATTITSFTATVTLADTAQLGRLSRNNATPQDWAGTEVYSGEVNPATTYHYHVYTLSSSLFNFTSGDYAGYVQIDVDSPSLNTFVSAFQDSYNPTVGSKGSNWLGDAAFSGNLVPGDPLFFQVLLTQGHDLLLVVNNTGANTAAGGIGDLLNITVEGFTDNAFDEPTGTQVPEPASLMLLGSGLVGIGSRIRRKFKA